MEALSQALHDVTTRMYQSQAQAPGGPTGAGGPRPAADGKSRTTRTWSMPEYQVTR